MLEKFQIKTHTDIACLARLSNAEDITDSTDFHISECYLKSCPEVRMIRDGHESFTSLILKFWLAVHEITNPLNLSSPHSSTELMKLCKSEVFCFVDDNGIRIEEVDTIFDDRRREEDIMITQFEFHNTVFELVRWELSVGDDHFCLWNKCLYFFFENWEGLDGVVNKEYFASTSEFLLNSPFDNRRIIASHSGMNRLFS